MQEIIIELLNKFGYLGVFLLITIENIFPPIPSEIILTFGGFMTTYTSINVWGVILTSTLGSLVGAIILYILGRILNVRRLEMLFDSKLGKLLHLKKGDVKMAEKWFLKHGNKTVFFCRFIPIVRSLISIPAGVAKMKLSSFLPLTVIGTFIWNTVLVFLGKTFGNAWEVIAGYFDTYSMMAAIFLILCTGLLGVIFIKKRFIKKDDKNI